MSKKLTANFSRDEMSCKCGCGKMSYAQAFMERLQMVRNIYDKPMIISSGTRCDDHNSTVSNNPQSDHVLGIGVDIVILNAIDRYKLIKIALDCGFDRVGIHARFVHLGISNGVNPPEVMWLY